MDFDKNLFPIGRFAQETEMENAMGGQRAWVSSLWKSMWFTVLHWNAQRFYMNAFTCAKHLRGQDFLVLYDPLVHFDSCCCWLKKNLSWTQRASRFYKSYFLLPSSSLHLAQRRALDRNVRWNLNRERQISAGTTGPHSEWQMSDRMLERMSEYMSENMSEDSPKIILEYM